MDYTNKDSLKPLLASIGMLSVATITSAAGAPFTAGAFGLAGKVVYDLLNSLAPNIASDQILKINPKKLREYFTSGRPNLSNHDLYKGYKNSIKLGLDGTVDIYKNNLPKDKNNKYHFNAILEKVEILKELIDTDFDEAFIDKVSDEKINDYAENRDTQLYDLIYDFLDIEALSAHGDQFLPFVKKVLPSQILAAFTEVLKNEDRVWIAYQRLLLTDIQTKSDETNLLSHEILGKINTLTVQMDMLQRMLDADKDTPVPDDQKLEQLWAFCEEAKYYRDFSIDKLEDYYTEITSRLNYIHTDLKKEIEKAGKEREIILTQTTRSVEIGEKTVKVSRDHFDEFLTYKEEATQQRTEMAKKHSQEIASLKALILENMKKEVLENSKDEKPEVIEETLEKLENSAQKIAEIDYDKAAGIVKEALDVVKKNNGVERALLILDKNYLDRMQQSANTEEVIRKVIESYEMRIELLKPTFKYSLITECYEEIINIYRKIQPKSNTLATTLLKAGNNLRANGNYSAALAHEKKAVAIKEEILDTKHPSLATSYGNIALTYDNLGSYAKALAYHQKAITIREGILDGQHPDLATSYNNIAVTYLKSGDFEVALVYSKKAIAIGREIFDVKDPVLSNYFNTIALIYDKLGNYSEALVFSKKAIIIREEIFDAKHPSLAASYGNIARTYEKLGSYTEALVYHQKSIAIGEEVFDAKHPTLATLYCNIALTYEKLGSYTEALVYHQKSIVIGEEVFDAKHPTLATFYNNIAVVYLNLDKLEDALVSSKKAIAILEEVFDTKHPDLANFYNNIAVTYIKLDNLEAALVNSKKAIAIGEEIFDLKHPNLINYYLNIAFIYKKFGSYLEALTYELKAITIGEEVFDSQHPDLGLGYLKVAVSYFRLNDLTNAFYYIKKAKMIIEAAYPPDHNYQEIVQSWCDSILNKIKNGEGER